MIIGKPIKCRVCGLVFRSKKDLIEHNGKMHPMGGTCNACGAAFVTSHELRIHTKGGHIM